MNFLHKNVKGRCECIPVKKGNNIYIYLGQKLDAWQFLYIRVYSELYRVLNFYLSHSESFQIIGDDHLGPGALHPDRL